MTFLCKSCGAPILWATKPDGKPHPLNAQTRMVAVIENRGGELRIVRWIHGHESHFSTCTHAASHRPPEPPVREHEQASLFESSRTVEPE